MGTASALALAEAPGQAKRYCKECGKILVKRPDEGRFNWERRQFCDRGCAIKYKSRQNHKSGTRRASQRIKFGLVVALPEGACRHHWVIESESRGGVYHATCKLCPATRTFPLEGEVE